MARDQRANENSLGMLWICFLIFGLSTCAHIEELKKRVKALEEIEVPVIPEGPPRPVPHEVDEVDPMVEFEQPATNDA